MANTQRAKANTTKKAKTYKFSTFRAEAEKRRADAPPRPEIPPFIIDDVEPHIVITAPDTVERQLVIAELVGPTGVPDMTSTLPLLRMLCGDEFHRVWMLVKDDPDPYALLPLVQAMFDHFSEVLKDVQEAAELPGGSGDSSN